MDINSAKAPRNCSVPLETSALSEVFSSLASVTPLTERKRADKGFMSVLPAKTKYN